MVARTFVMAGPRALKSSGLLVTTALCLTLMLSGCDSAEERAEEHYQSGLALLEEGDTDRALVEFRNVFQLNPKHHDARAAYAKAQRERGLFQEAYGQYLRLVEQYPDDLEGQIALSEMALQLKNWEELERHSSEAMKIAPEDLRAQSLANSVAYFKARRDQDEEAARASVQKAQQLVDQNDDLQSARRIVIDDLIQNQQWEEALAGIDEAIAKDDDDLALYQLRLGLLKQLGDTEGFRTQLETLAEKYPEDTQISEALLTYYIDADELEKAESILRADAEATDDPTPTRRLIAFLRQYRGEDAAIAELKAVVDEGRLPVVPFQTYLAIFQFQKGETSEAIAALETLDTDAERTGDIRDMEIELARMYFQTGNSVAARRLVEAVLEEDANHPGASKLKAAWLIQDDETDDAIPLLRNAMGQSPRDVELMTLMAQAHEREGNRELMTEMLALAVDASGNAPEPSLRYARALVADDQALSAESVLIDALRLAPENLDLLGALGRLYVSMENYPQAGGVVQRLKELDTDASKVLAMSVEAESLSAQGRNDDLMALLQGVAENPDTKKAGVIAIFRTRLEQDGTEAGMAYLDELLKENPEDPDYRFLKAGMLVIDGQDAEAEQMYRALLEEQPDNARVWTSLYRMKRLRNLDDEASAVLREALAASPDEPGLKIALAEEMQSENDFEGAIGIYEELYDANPNAVVVANNLASLLADHRTDEESIKRAYAVARRLRGAEAPALQDTYGWIAYRMGNVDEALPYLEGAAAGLTGDARVQYHYGVALDDAGRDYKAKEQLTLAKEMVADAPEAPDFVADIDARLAQIEATGTPAPDSGASAPAGTSPGTDAPATDAPATDAPTTDAPAETAPADGTPAGSTTGQDAPAGTTPSE